jgi:hypothetical protein
MSKKEVSVIIRAKNAMAAGLSSAGAALKNFGQSAARIGAAFAKAFLVAGTAIVGFGVKAVQAFSVQEKAEKEAEAALRAWGDEVDGNMKKIKAFASAIQNETGIADENTIARAAKLRMLGVEADALEAATKATIALGKAGMGEEQAIKAVAMARNGNFAALNRYIPALRNAATEEEKAQILNDFLTKGFAAQKEELDTVGGKWNALKGRMGDFMEVVGGAIANTGALTGALDKAGDAVQRMGAKLQEWIEGDGINRWIQTFKYFGNNVRETFEQIGAYARYSAENMVESVQWFGDSVVTIFTNFGKFAQNSFSNIVDNAGYAWARVSNHAENAFQKIKTFHTNLTNHIGYGLAQMYAKVTGEDFNIEPPVLEEPDPIEWNIAWPDNKGLLEGLEDFPKKAGEAAARLDKSLAELAKKREEREKEITDRRIGRNKEAADQAAQVEEKAQEKIEIARVNPVKAIEEEIKAVKEKMRIHGEMAKKTIADILAENKARKDAAKSWEQDSKKAAELRARVGRGVKLSQKDAEWLDAFEQIEAARKGLGAAQGQIENAQKQLDAIKDQKKELVNIRDELKNMHRDLNNLLERG